MFPDWGSKSGRAEPAKKKEEKGLNERKNLKSRFGKRARRWLSMTPEAQRGGGGGGGLELRNQQGSGGDPVAHKTARMRQAENGKHNAQGERTWGAKSSG